MKTLGFYLREGGSCRHRSAGLQLTLQEAGIASRYVRGTLMGSGSHAWVEVGEDRAGEEMLVLDPNFGVHGLRSEREPLAATDGADLMVFALADAGALGDARPEDLAYMVDRRHTNTIWRPLRRRFETARSDRAGATELAR